MNMPYHGQAMAVPLAWLVTCPDARMANTEVHANPDGTPMHIAARSKHLNVLNLLITAGADKNPYLEGGWTPLLLASKDLMRGDARSGPVG